MNHKEVELLDDLEAWRGAKVAKVYEGHHVTQGQGRLEDTVALLKVSNGRYSRHGVEPEMIEAMKRVREAIDGLEPARQKIVERKLYELRLAGMRAPSEGATDA